MKKISAERYDSGSPQLSSERYTSGSPVSSERYSSGENLNKPYSVGGNYRDTVPIRIFVSPGSASSPSTTISMLPGEGMSRHIMVESGQSQGKSTPFRTSKDECFQVTSHDSCSTDSSNGGGVAGSDSSTGGLADSGVWIKSYGGSFDMQDAVDGVSGVSDSGVFSVCSTADQESSSLQITRPARKPSYLSAVNAPVPRSKWKLYIV